MITAFSVGFFLILVGMLFITTPNLYDKIVAFVNDFSAVRVPHLEGVYLPAPVDPRAHVDVYMVARQFSLIWGMFLVALLGTRFILGTPLRRRAENMGDIVFWLGTAYLIQTMLINATRWFEFWAAIIALIGISLIIRAVFLALARAVKT
jgi:hypothetical protein